MKQDLKLICLVVASVTTLLLVLPCVSTAQSPVPYYEQRHGIGPLSWSEQAYLRRLVEEEEEEEDGSMEVTTNAGEAEGSDAWDNSCVSEPVNAGGFSVEDEVKESDGASQEGV